jgi:(4S)-4-hydroxy-5-phosphonooxypentane-2,3-dione isomerase
MHKPTNIAAATLALVVGVAVFGLTPSREALAQSSGVYINAVDLEIAPGQIANYIALIKENGAATIKEPGCLQFSIAVLASDPNHVFLYEVYESEAALATHRATDHFKKYAAATASMVVDRKATAMTPIAFNIKPN